MSMSSGFQIAAFNIYGLEDTAPRLSNASERQWLKQRINEAYGTAGLQKLWAGDYIQIDDWVIWKIPQDKPKVDPTIEAREQAQRQARKARGRTEWSEAV